MDPLRDLLDWAPFGYFTASDDNTVSASNAASARLLGYDSPDEVTSLSLGEVFYDRALGEHFVERVTEDRPIRSALHMLVNRANESVPVLMTGRSVRGREDGAAIELIVQDVRERIHLQEELRQAQKLDAIGRLAGGMAHDFNNLLMIVQGRAELALNKLEEGNPAVRHLYAIHRTTTQAESLTRELLAFSRNQTLQFRRMSVNNVISDTRDLVNRWLGEDIEFRIDVEPDLWPVRGDPAQIQQVFVNLVLNARDAMPQGGRLKVRTANLRDFDFGDGRVEDAVLLEVRDNGRGMDEATLSMVFDPFFSTKPRGEGTGLGLSTAYGVITQSDGVIQVESVPGGGTAFTVVLPRIAGDIEGRRDISGSPGTRLQSLERKGVVLLVEDRHDLRVVLRSFLEDMGHDVVTAADAEAVVAPGSEVDDVDLVVTDVVLTTMSGVELVRDLREKRPELPVVFMTGFNDHPLVAEVIRQGEPLLMKPFTRADLEEAVLDCLGRSPQD